MLTNALKRSNYTIDQALKWYSRSNKNIFNTFFRFFFLPVEVNVDVCIDNWQSCSKSRKKGAYHRLARRSFMT